MRVVASQFYGCCGAHTYYFGYARVDPDELARAEQASANAGYGVVICIVKQGQWSTKILETAGWSMVAVSKGRTGARLNTWVKVLKPFTPSHVRWRKQGHSHDY